MCSFYVYVFHIHTGEFHAVVNGVYVDWECFQILLFDSCPSVIYIYEATEHLWYICLEILKPDSIHLAPLASAFLQAFRTGKASGAMLL